MLISSPCYAFFGKSHPEIDLNHIRDDLVNKHIPGWQDVMQLAWMKNDPRSSISRAVIKILESKYKKDNAIVYIFFKRCIHQVWHAGKVRLLYEWAAGDWNLVGIKTISVKRMTEKEEIAFFSTRLGELGKYPLHQAAAVGDLDMVKDAISKGANVNEKEGKRGTRPLGLAVERGNTEVVRFLISKGADVKAANNNGFTALMAAAIKGSLETVKLLLRKGADVNARSSNGRTALDISRNSDIKKLLKKAGAR